MDDAAGLADLERLEAPIGPVRPEVVEVEQRHSVKHNGVAAWPAVDVDPRRNGSAEPHDQAVGAVEEQDARGQSRIQNIDIGADGSRTRRRGRRRGWRRWGGGFTPVIGSPLL
jgi:hypothetical protein